MRKAARMPRGTIALLVVVLVGAMAAGAPSQPSGTDQAIVHVLVWRPGSFYRRGTAFHIGNGVFYTAASAVTYRVPDGFTTWYLAGTTATRSTDSWLGPLSVTCIHPQYRVPDINNPLFSPFDVAQLRVGAAEYLPALQFAPALPYPGMRVRVKGYPDASREWPPSLYTAEGRVVSVNAPTQTFRVDIETGLYRGWGGAPVLAPDNAVLGVFYAWELDRVERIIAATAQVARSGCPLP